jgi:succinate dehydrogenase/fumarate reductase cytochrome b subunit
MAFTTITRAGQQRRTTSPSASFWPWIIQRITGVFLVVLMTIHIVVNHFGNISKVGTAGHPDTIVFSDVAFRLGMAFWWLIDVLLLGFVLFHGLNGIRNIAIDLGVRGGTPMRVVSGFLWMIGIAAFVFGIFALIAFRRYS